MQVLGAAARKMYSKFLPTIPSLMCAVKYDGTDTFKLSVCAVQCS